MLLFFFFVALRIGRKRVVCIGARIIWAGKSGRTGLVWIRLLKPSFFRHENMDIYYITCIWYIIGNQGRELSKEFWLVGWMKTDSNLPVPSVFDNVDSELHPDSAPEHSSVCSCAETPATFHSDGPLKFSNSFFVWLPGLSCLQQWRRDLEKLEEPSRDRSSFSPTRMTLILSLGQRRSRLKKQRQDRTLLRHLYLTVLMEFAKDQLTQIGKTGSSDLFHCSPHDRIFLVNFNWTITSKK